MSKILAFTNVLSIAIIGATYYFTRSWTAYLLLLIPIFSTLLLSGLSLEDKKKEEEKHE